MGSERLSKGGQTEGINAGRGVFNYPLHHGFYKLAWLIDEFLNRIPAK
jgi:hypothetical protein